MMKKHFSMALTAILLLLAGSVAFAQSITRGKVVDANGEPVIGASVVVPGTTTGVVTDVDGNFELRVAPGTRLEISCIGYSTVTATAAPTLNITLEEDTTYLDDVVVIGYQTVKRRDLTGSVASITGKEIVATPSPRATNRSTSSTLSPAPSPTSPPTRSSTSTSSRMPPPPPSTVPAAPTALSS